MGLKCGPFNAHELLPRLGWGPAGVRGNSLNPELTLGQTMRPLGRNEVARAWEWVWGVRGELHNAVSVLKALNCALING